MRGAADRSMRPDGGSPRETAPSSSPTALRRPARQPLRRGAVRRLLLPLALLGAYALLEALRHAGRVGTAGAGPARGASLLGDDRNGGGGTPYVGNAATRGGGSRREPMHRCRVGRRHIQVPKNIPGFLIIGAQKGGTTALFALLSMQRGAMGSNVPETHFFNHYIRHTKQGAKPLADLTDEDVCLLRQKYVKRYFDVPQYLNMTKARDHHPVVVFEKTPAYLRTPGVAARLRRVLGPDLKLLVVLRDPIDRAFSYYSMIRRHDARAFCDEAAAAAAGDKDGGTGRGGSGNDLSFDRLVAREVEQLRRAGLTRAPPLEGFDPDDGLGDDDNDPRFAPPNLTATELGRTLGALVRRSSPIGSNRLCGIYWNSLYMGLYALQLREWVRHYPLGTHLRVIRSEALREDARAVYSGVLDFIGLPSAGAAALDERALTRDLGPERLGLFNATDREVRPPSERTRRYLRRFYRPYNDALADLLGEDWRNVWGGGGSGSG